MGVPRLTLPPAISPVLLLQGGQHSQHCARRAHHWHHGHSRASIQDPPLLCSMRQSQRSPGAHWAPALPANRLLSSTFSHHSNGIVLLRNCSGVPSTAQLCPGQPALASCILTPSGNWHRLDIPSRQLG